MKIKCWPQESLNSRQLSSQMKDLRPVLIWSDMIYPFSLCAVKINRNSVNARVAEYVNCLLCFKLALTHFGKSNNDWCGYRLRRQPSVCNSVAGRLNQNMVPVVKSCLYADKYFMWIQLQKLMQCFLII